MEEDNKQNNQQMAQDNQQLSQNSYQSSSGWDKNNQPSYQESKAGIGFVCAFFLGVMGLIIGYCCFKGYERQTFLKGFWITFGVVYGIAILLIVITFAAGAFAATTGGF